MNTLDKINQGTAQVGVIGMGYVGFPLFLEFGRRGFSVTGFDIDPAKVEDLQRGKSYIKHIPDQTLEEIRDHYQATADFSLLANMDCILICVPTPLSKHREPDLSFVLATSESIRKNLRPGQLVVLESTTYPGTTDEEVRTVLEKDGLQAGRDFYLAYSPEREDPNNKNFNTRTIPKVVGGYTSACGEVANALYQKIVDETVPVGSTKVAEAAKLLENIYRAVNIAMVNELKVLFDRMDIDIWEVIEAAKTKPFGFQAFYPGPGLGGHCIPIDPFYLTWKAREYDVATRFIELSGEINSFMPYYVLEKIGEALNQRELSYKGSSILVLGMAYKKNVDDTRESPAFRIMELLREKGAHVDYNDPHVPELPMTRKYKWNMKSVDLTAENLSRYDCTVIITDHSDYDPEFIGEHAQVVVDTRNLIPSHSKYITKVVKA